MTISELKKQLLLTELAGPKAPNEEVTCCYIGDLLSWVLAKAPEQCAWITVMGNVNAVAVAKLTDAACIILCEGAALDEEAKTQADANSVCVFSSQRPAYELAVAIGRLLGEGR